MSAEHRGVRFSYRVRKSQRRIQEMQHSSARRATPAIRRRAAGAKIGETPRAYAGNYASCRAETYRWMTEARCAWENLRFCRASARNCLRRIAIHLELKRLARIPGSIQCCAI